MAATTVYVVQLLASTHDPIPDHLAVELKSVQSLSVNGETIDELILEVQNVGEDSIQYKPFHLQEASHKVQSVLEIGDIIF